MARPKPPMASPDDIEHEFYEALQHGDIERLMAVWADDDDVVCVHPGGPRLLGPGAIRASFEAIFANGAIALRPESVHRVQTHACAVHSVLEGVQVMTDQGPHTAWVAATNVYLKTAQGWRMAAHHASPGTPAPAQEAGAGGSVLH